MAELVIPDTMTPEQIEVVGEVLEKMMEVFWLSYGDQIVDLWRQRDGFRDPYRDDTELPVPPPSGSTTHHVQLNDDMDMLF